MTDVVSSLPQVTESERKAAAAVHLVGIFAPLWVPLVVWVLFKGRSRFVASHAWAELWDGIILKGVLLLLMVVSTVWTVVRLVHHIRTEFKEFDWTEAAWKIVLTLAVMVVLWVWNLAQALVQTRRASKGEWPKSELRKLLKQSASA